VSRPYLVWAVIGLLLVAVGIAVALVYRAHRTQESQSSNAPTAPPVPPSPAPAVSGSAAAVRPLAEHAASQTTATDSKFGAGALVGAAVPMLRPLPKAAAAMADSDNCPYPREAVDQGLTGTVLLLVDVSSEGRPMKTKMDKSSGSEILDQATVRCVEQFGRFPAPPAGSTSGGYWGRIRFKWSFEP
jgi:protein TonB